VEFIKTKVQNMNPRKGFRNIFLASIIFMIVAGVSTGIRFGDRIPEIKQAFVSGEQINDSSNDFLVGAKETDDEIGSEKREEHEVDWENFISFASGDYVFIGIIIAGFFILLGIYWLYTTAYAVFKSWKVGVNAWLFGVLTLFTNLVGVVSLWIYIKMHPICSTCGKLQQREANNCTCCGAAIFVNCPNCGKRISIKDQYCIGCGKNMHHEDK
jgi:hypothetical protein